MKLTIRGVGRLTATQKHIGADWAGSIVLTHDAYQKWAEPKNDAEHKAIVCKVTDLRATHGIAGPLEVLAPVSKGGHVVHVVDK